MNDLSDTPLDLWNTAQAAQYLGVSTARVRVLCAEGRLSARKVGRDWVIEPTGLFDFAAIPRRPGRPPKA